MAQIRRIMADRYRKFTRPGRIAETTVGASERRRQSHPIDRPTTARLAASHPQSERRTADVSRAHQSLRRRPRRARGAAFDGAARWWGYAADLLAGSSRAGDRSRA